MSDSDTESFHSFDSGNDYVDNDIESVKEVVVWNGKIARRNDCSSDELVISHSSSPKFSCSFIASNRLTEQADQETGKLARAREIGDAKDSFDVGEEFHKDTEISESFPTDTQLFEGASSEANNKAMDVDGWEDWNIEMEKNENDTEKIADENSTSEDFTNLFQANKV